MTASRLICGWGWTLKLQLSGLPETADVSASLDLWIDIVDVVFWVWFLSVTWSLSLMDVAGERKGLPARLWKTLVVN